MIIQRFRKRSVKRRARMRPEPALRIALRPLRRRMRYAAALRFGTWGVAAACAVALGWMIASFFTPIEGRLAWLSASAGASLALSFALGLLWPLPWRKVVYCADDGGLAQRVETLIEQTQPSAMARLLREDTLARLRALSLKTAAPYAKARAPWITSGAAALAVLCLCFVTNPQQAVLDARDRTRQALAAQADALETRMQAVEDAQLNEGERTELRRLTTDLSQQLRKMDNTREALTALDQGQRKMNELLTRSFARSLAEQASGLDTTAMDAIAKAMERLTGSEGAKSLTDALKTLAADPNDAQALELLADTLGTADSLEEAAQELESALADASSSAGSAGQAMANAASAAQSAGTSSGSLSSLMQWMRAGISQANASSASGRQPGSTGQSGQSGQGSTGQSAGRGSSQGQGQGGTGQGQGQGSSGQGQGGGVGGSSILSDRVAAYEPIYDPKRLGGDAPASQVQGSMNEGASSQLELGPGQGSLEGSVPYGEVIGSYQEAAAQAMRRENLPASLREWVNRYFEALID